MRWDFTHVEIFIVLVATAKGKTAEAKSKSKSKSKKKQKFRETQIRLLFFYVYFYFYFRGIPPRSNTWQTVENMNHSRKKRFHQVVVKFFRIFAPFQILAPKLRREK